MTAWSHSYANIDTHSVGHGHSLWKMAALTASVCASRGGPCCSCGCRSDGRRVFSLLVRVSGGPHNDRIPDCKVLWWKSAHMLHRSLCAHSCVCVCLCYLYVQAVVPDLFTGTSFNFLLGPCLFCISLGLCVCFCVCLRQRKGFAPGDLSKEFALSRHIQLFHFLCVSEKGWAYSHVCNGMLTIYPSVFLYLSSHNIRNTQLGSEFIKRGGDFLRSNDPPGFEQFLASHLYSM